MALGQGLLQALDHVVKRHHGLDLQQAAQHNHVEGFAVVHLVGGIHGVDAVDLYILARGGMDDAVAVKNQYSARLHFALKLLERGLVQDDGGIVAAQDGPAIIKIFKDLVLKSYGEKSADGRRFIKNDEMATAFSQTEAYSEIFMKLATDADAASKFVNEIVPADVEKKAKPALKKADK